jgi:hypothetical protein
MGLYEREDLPDLQGASVQLKILPSQPKQLPAA